MSRKQPLLLLISARQEALMNSYGPISQAACVKGSCQRPSRMDNLMGTRAAPC